jgi:uncharacterized protein
MQINIDLNFHYYMEIQSLRIELPPDIQIIVAQSHFIKTVEDVSECLVNCVPNIKYGIAFCEASGPCLVRHSGNDGNLDLLATDYAFRISSGHSLIILIKDAFPINILPRLRDVSEIVNIYCATANPVEIIFVETQLGRAILGVVDGFKSKGIESEKEIEERKRFLRKIGYKMFYTRKIPSGNSSSHELLFLSRSYYALIFLV